MVFQYYIRYYYGDNDTFDYEDVRVYYSTSNSISGVTFTPDLPNTYGGSEYNTGTTKKITYKPLNASGADTLGISWSVNEPIIKKFREDSWSSGIGTKTIVSISDLAWTSVIEGNVQRFTHATYRVPAGEVVRLSLPEQYEFNGFYSPHDIKYLTVEYGYSKTAEKISLNSQVYSRVTVRYWNSGEGSELEPGIPVDVPIGIVSSTYDGPYSSITYHTRSDAKTYQQLLSSIDTTRPNEDCSFQVSLMSDPEQFHNSETLNVSAYKTYQFNKWKTTSGNLNLSGKPSTSNVTVYADWTNTDTVVQTSLPQWTTTQNLQYGSDSLTLNCFKEPTDTVPYFTRTALKYEFKPAKHVSWKVGSTNYSVGTTVTEGAGTVYTAVWEADSTGTSTYQFENNVIDLPTPSRDGWQFSGWTDSAVFDAKFIDTTTHRLNESLVPSYWIYSDSIDTTYEDKQNDVFVGWDYLVNNSGNTVPVLYKTDTEIPDIDFQDKFFYVGTEVYQGVPYDKWRKIEEQGIDWNHTATVYIYTPRMVVGNPSGNVYTTNYTVTNEVTLFAVWTSGGAVQIYNKSSKRFEQYKIVIYNSSTNNWEEYSAKIYNGTSWSDSYM